MKKAKKVVKLMRVDRETGYETELASFASRGDALWAATLFQSHKVFSRRFTHYITSGTGKYGTKIEYPAGILSINTFYTDIQGG